MVFQIELTIRPTISNVNKNLSKFNKKLLKSGMEGAKNLKK